MAETRETWRALDEDGRLDWARNAAGDLTEDGLRRAILETSAGRGPFAVAGGGSLNLSRAASLVSLRDEVARQEATGSHRTADPDSGG